jgi:hypothetical protein
MSFLSSTYAPLAAPSVSSIWRRQSMQAKWSLKLSLHGQQLFTPTGIERNLVVGDHMGALLFGRHGVDPLTGHLTRLRNLLQLRDLG